MKKLLLLLAFAASVSFASAASRIDPLSTSDSGCHADGRSFFEDTNPSWDIKYTDGILSVTWLDYEANCCPGEFKGWIELEDGNKLIYNLGTTEDQCDCYCVFDITNTYGTIAPGHYTITFRDHGHIWEYSSYYSDVLTAEVDIEEGCTLTLKAPAAGIKTIDATTDKMSLTEDGVLHIDVAGAYAIEIFDAAGIRCVHIDAKDASEVLVASLQKGAYIARLIVGDATETLRFVR